MRTFATALLAIAVSARGTSGGINQGQLNASKGGRHGYGYNIGNSYSHGDSHGNNIQHQMGYGFPSNPNMGGGQDGGAPDAHDHLSGYDTVKPYDDDDYDATLAANQSTLRDSIVTQITDLQAQRVAYINGVLDMRKDRLNEIHEDNLLKIEAPFDLQLDLLEEEVSDINQAMTHAVGDAGTAFADLEERMLDYLADRIEALNREADRVIRTLERAQTDFKHVDEVLYAMRLDWLSGIYVSGVTAYYDADVYDMGFFDSEFDLFTFDIGHGKGHGHRASPKAPGNDRDTGMVIGGRGATGSIDTLRGRPQPEDGKRRRYDRATQSGHGKETRRSDYEIGLQAGRTEGQYGYNQSADLGVEETIGAPRGMAPKKRRPMKKRPTKYGRKPTSYGRRPAPKKPTYRRKMPTHPYQRTRQITKRTSYDDYAPIRRGYYY